MDSIALNFDSQTFWLIVTLLIAGTFATDVWRAAGVYLSRDLKPDSPVVQWVRDVSTALLAGLVARLLFFPSDPLSQVPLAIRLAAFASGVLVFFLSGRQLVLSLCYGLGVLLVVQWALT